MSSHSLNSLNDYEQSVLSLWLWWICFPSQSNNILKTYLTTLYVGEPRELTIGLISIGHSCVLWVTHTSMVPEFIRDLFFIIMKYCSGSDWFIYCCIDTLCKISQWFVETAFNHSMHFLLISVNLHNYHRISFICW